MKRAHQIVLIVSTFTISWLGMMVVHEAGHVLGAWTSGGVVSRVNLPLFGFSSTELYDNTHPLWEVWAGPVFGAVAPLLAWVVTYYFKASFSYLLRFFAGFCLLANGAYLGAGSFDRIADAGNLLELGTPVWQLWLFGAVCMPAGFVMWHRLGPGFGLSGTAGKVNIRHAYILLGLLIVLVFIETALMLT